MTIFDIVTVACFLALVAAFFFLTDQSPGLLLRFIVSGLLFAVANQAGNAGNGVLALAMILAGVGWAAWLVRAARK